MLPPALFPHYGSFQFFTFLLFQSESVPPPFSPSSFLCVFPAFPRPFLYGSHLTDLHVYRRSRCPSPHVERGGRADGKEGRVTDLRHHALIACSPSPTLPFISRSKHHSLCISTGSVRRIAFATEMGEGRWRKSGWADCVVVGLLRADRRPRPFLGYLRMCGWWRREGESETVVSERLSGPLLTPRLFSLPRQPAPPPGFGPSLRRPSSASLAKVREERVLACTVEAGEQHLRLSAYYSSHILRPKTPACTG